ncbi:hypothetical protein CDL12_25380 [Handroanthus impetiginosus]|uniref:TRF2/HOY1 PH-like domain-containing protein n=1 Tax=Handroanthus impetiginosus TaxID=429701 RepID=A0A2G9G9Z0_9LAMI|nr:hypothetical protein CDL12_25380 [Handroanthus impetiginosus]
MGESDESVYWSGKEGSNTSEELQYDQSNYDEEYGSKRIRLSPDSDRFQEGDIESCAQSSPLGLTLRKTPSFLSLVQMSLSKGNQSDFSGQDNIHVSNHDKPRPKMDHHLVSQPVIEKLKASNFPATFVKIGAWQRITRHEGDLIAKIYYAKRKMVWEVLDGALKSKIEIQWCDIIAIRAETSENEPGTLEVECMSMNLLTQLNQPPLFYRETNPQPRKHTLWQQAPDFTGGQAPIWRRHHVRFPPGILDKHYEKLLQCDERLFILSQKPFPSHESPYFDPTMFGISQVPSFSLNGYGSAYLRGMSYPNQTYPATPFRLAPSSTLSVMDLPYRHKVGNNNQLVNTATPWGQGTNVFRGNHATNQAPSHGIASAANQVLHSQHYQSNVRLLDDIENHMLGESQVGSSDEGTLRANVQSIYSLLQSTDMINANHSGMSYQVTDNTTDQVIQNGTSISDPFLDGLYSDNLSWMPAQESNDSLVMEQMVNNSIPPFVFPGNTSNGEFFDL